MRRAQQQTIVFLCTNTSGTILTGLVFADGEVQLSKDGGAFVALLGARVTEIGLGYYRVTLTADEKNASCIIVAVRKPGVSTNNDQFGYLDAQPTFAVVADAGNTASTFVTNLTSSVTDYLKGVLVRCQTGALADQVRKVSGYNGTTKALTFATPFTAAPSAGDVFAIVND